MRKSEKLCDAIFCGVVLLSILAFALLQPFGDPPDEVNRFKVAQFICRHSALPTGEEFEVAIGGYGGSYAFQPILPYMVQAFFMRILSVFTAQERLLLLCARLVNAVFGVVMAVYVRRLSRLLFSRPMTGWLFCFLVMFLPQNLFLHSYVNTDSMAAMSGAMIVYACVKGWKEGWGRRELFTLSAGIIFCTLSYYNAYGLIVSAILLFFFSHIRPDENGHCHMDWKALFQRGALISLLVLLGAGWWFLRNYLIHDGDLLGLRSRTQHAIRTALPQYNPATRITVKGSGVSLREMLQQTDFLYFLWNSFVARFGPMTLPTLPFLYIWYYRIFGFGWLFCLLPVSVQKMCTDFRADTYGKTASIDIREKAAAVCEKPSGTVCADTGGAGKEPGDSARRRKGASLLLRILFDSALLLSVFIPFGLCVYYSYASDYQPQGRYIMPMLIPFMYFTALGFDKAAALIERYLPVPPLRKYCRPAMMGGLSLFLIAALFLTIACVVLPHYLTGENLWNAWPPLS